MNPEDFSMNDATALAELVAKKEVTPQELVDVSIDIITQLNPEINAVVRLMKEEATRFAAGPLSNTPFKGVPLGIKDDESIHYAGVPTENSSMLTKDMMPAGDTTLMTRYKEAGLNGVAKTNMPEFSASVTTESKVNGICKNPWGTSLTVGGSSGGSACGVAAGMFPVAYGNDGAGSIRIPASCCGVFGMKATRGRIPKGPFVTDEWNGLSSDNIITKSVRDCAAIMDHSEGIDVGAPYAAPAHENSFLSVVGKVEKPFKIAVMSSLFSGEPIHPDCKKSVLDTARLCEALGHHVEETHPALNMDEVVGNVLVILKAHSAYGLGELFKLRNLTPSKEWTDNINFDLYEMGMKLSATDLLKALKSLAEMSLSIAPFFEEYDFLLTPVTTTPPVPHGFISQMDEDVDRFVKNFCHFTAFTPFANVTGQPAMSIPLFNNQLGVPIGSHFVAKLGAEEKLFQLAGQLEEALPWHNRIPPIHASRL